MKGVSIMAEKKQTSEKTEEPKTEKNGGKGPKVVN